MRPEIQDVVVLVTDGRPTNFPKANKTAKLLKDKGILIVGAAIGPERHKFMHKLEQLASGEEYVVNATLDKLDDVIGKIINKSCSSSGAPGKQCQYLDYFAISQRWRSVIPRGATLESRGLPRHFYPFI